MTSSGRAARRRRAPRECQGKPVNLDRGKGLTIGGAVVSAIFGIALISALPPVLLEDGIAAFAYLSPVIGFFCGGLGMLYAGTQRTKKAKRFRKYLALIGRRESISITTLAQAMPISVHKACDDLQEMLDTGILSTGYLDMSSGRLILNDEGLREEEPAPHYLPEVVTACCATRDAVSAAQGEGAFPVTLGGDHALGLGTVAGTAQHYSPEELSLVWVDAHTDINTENSSLSGNIHGMPIAALLGLCGQELSSVCGGLPALRPENVHIIFARDIDPAEERIIAEQGVHLYRMSEIKEQGLSAVLHRLLGNITTPFCHVSWDVDSLDASFIPATGLPIPDGPDPKAVTDVLLALAASSKMVALDCVEYNPARDSDGSCCRTVLGILEPVLLALAAKP